MAQRSEIKIRVLGLAEQQERVKADVFATKLRSLVHALRIADEGANGKRNFDYLIVDLKPSSASVTLQEYSVVKAPPDFSGVEELGKSARAIADGRFAEITVPSKGLLHLKRLAAGAGKQHSHIEMWVDGAAALRVDDFFEAQAQEAFRLKSAKEMERLPYYKGTAIMAFDGLLELVDLRGSVPRLKLTLTAGGTELDCTYKHSIDDLREHLGRRVWAEGMAHYSGLSGLPTRIEIGLIRSVKAEPDIQRWRGAFRMEDDDNDSWESE